VPLDSTGALAARSRLPRHDGVVPVPEGVEHERGQHRPDETDDEDRHKALRTPAQRLCNSAP
jgi:hypothetical protein